MKFRSVFSPIHQGHQQLIGSAKFGWSPKVGQPFLHDFEHLAKGVSLDTRQSLELCILQMFDRFVSHVPIMAHLCKRSIL